jgi:hypothetical protein
MVRPPSCIPALLAVAALLAPSAALAQRLRRASDAVHTGSSDRRDRDHDRDGHPPRSSSDPPSRGGRSRWFQRRAYLPFPYAWGYGGYDAPAGSSRTVAVIASLDGGLTLPDIGRGGVGLRILGPALEFELRYSVYAEPSREQTLWAALGRIRGGLAIADEASARFRFFGGLLHWADDVGSEFGFEGGVGLDVFPASPWALSFEASGGLVGRSGLIGLRGSVGYLFGPVELQAGWQHESLIPTVSGGNVDLTGPFVGLRLWR